MHGGILCPIGWRDYKPEKSGTGVSEPVISSFRMLRLIFLICLCAAVCLAANISGSWSFAVETSQGSGSPSFEFKQDGEKLTGTYSGMFGKAEITGSVKG